MYRVPDPARPPGSPGPAAGGRRVREPRGVDTVPSRLAKPAIRLDLGCHRRRRAEELDDRPDLRAAGTAADRALDSTSSGTRTNRHGSRTNGSLRPALGGGRDHRRSAMMPRSPTPTLPTPSSASGPAMPVANIPRARLPGGIGAGRAVVTGSTSTATPGRRQELDEYQTLSPAGSVRVPHHLHLPRRFVTQVVSGVFSARRWSTIGGQARRPDEHIGTPPAGSEESPDPPAPSTYVPGADVHRGGAVHQGDGTLYAGA